MLNRFARALVTRLFSPVARALLRLGVSPDVVTVVGTLGVCAGALIFYPTGHFVIGTLVITAFVFSDTIDGVMARLSGRPSKWGRSEERRVGKECRSSWSQNVYYKYASFKFLSSNSK